MDTNRIIIKQVDTSRVSTIEDTTVVGFTTVKAAKGPITPVYLPAASTAKMKDIFGVASEDYPDLFEASTFNSEYGLYVSAPYTKAGVPFAVITEKGIVKMDCLMEYNSDIEAYVMGEDIDIVNPKLLDMEGNPITDTISRLYDTRYAGSYGFGKNAVDVAKYNTDGHFMIGFTSNGTDDGELYFCTGIALGDVLTLSNKTFLLKNILKQDSMKFEISSINGATSVIKSLLGYLVKETVKGGTDDFIYVKPSEYSVSKYSADKFKVIELEVGDLKASCTLKTFGTYTWAASSSLLTKINDTTTGFKKAGENDWTLATIEANFPEIKKVVEDTTGDPEAYDLDCTIGATVSLVKTSSTGGRTLVTYGKLSIEQDHTLGDSDKRFFVTVVITGDTTASSTEVLTPVSIARYLGNAKTRKTIESYWEDVQQYDETTFFEDIYAIIFPKYPSSRALHLSFAGEDKISGYEFNSVDSRNIFTITAYEEGAFHGTSSQSITVTGSLDKDYKNAYGAYIGFNSSNSSYASQELFAVLVRKKFTDITELDTTVSKYASLVLSEGFRDFGDEVDDLYNLGWVQGQNPELDVDVYFNPRKYTAKPNTASDYFFTLSSYCPFAGMIFNITPNTDTLDGIQKEFPSAVDFGEQYWCFGNQFNVEVATNHRIVSPITGAIALMEARIIENKLGGIAPMFLNRNGLGGQFPVSVTRCVHKYDKYVQDYLVKVNINPVILDHTYGVMSVGQKTCQAGELTDRSYIGHEASFLNFIKEIRENVMIPQIGKHNNDYYRTLRKEQTEQYISKRTSGTDNIWAEAICDTSTADGVNDVECLRSRMFRIVVKVKVTIFSEYVELYFENTDQGADLTV